MVKEGVTDAQWAAHKAELAERKPFRDFRYIRTGNDGVVHHISVNGKPMFDEPGVFRGYRGAGREITAQVQAEDALRQANADAEASRSEAERHRRFAEETSRLLLEAQRIGKIGHWVTDPLNETITWSPQMFEIAGMEPAPEMPLARARKPFHPDDLSEFMATRERAIATGKTLQVESRWVRPGGDIRWVHSEISPQYDATGLCTGLMGTTQAIT